MPYHYHSVFLTCKKHPDTESFVEHYNACSFKIITKYTVIFIYYILNGDVIH